MNSQLPSEADLHVLLEQFLDVEAQESYATILTKCCFSALNPDGLGMEQLAEVADLISHVLKLFDDVIDNDIDLAYWQNKACRIDSIEKARASQVNLGTALFALVGEKLAAFYQFENFPTDVVSMIQRETFKQISPIVRGQQASVLITEPTLATSIKIAELKSGHFYGMVCWNAAYLATFDAELAGKFKEFGQLFGMIVQIANDMSDIWSHEGNPSDLKLGLWSLPVTYAMSVLPEGEKVRLSTYIVNAKNDKEAEAEARKILVKAGAFVYWQVENQLRFNRAKTILEELMPSGASRDKLIALLKYLLTVMPQ